MLRNTHWSSRGRWLLLLEGRLDLDELMATQWPTNVEAEGEWGPAEREEGRTSVFFLSDFSPRSFSCPSTRFLNRWLVSTGNRGSEEGGINAHLTADEFQPGIDVLLGFCLVLLDEYRTYEFVYSVICRQCSKFLRCHAMRCA